MKNESDIAIRIEGLTKTYGTVEAVRGVDLTVQKGEMFAFLGPNGAGKSTVIEMLCTLRTPTSGTIQVAGHDCVKEPGAVRANIGLVFQDRTLDNELTAEENLRFHADLYGVPAQEMDDRIVRALTQMNLLERRKSKVGTFSGGMARRLEIARALIHQPKVLFLDEPTIGLDPQTRVRMWTDLRRLRDETDITLFVTTHYMEEAEVADRVAILDAGRIVALGTPSVLKAQVGRDRVVLTTPNDAAAVAAIREAGHDADHGETGVTVFVADGPRAVAEIVQAAGVPVHSLTVHQPSLEEVFLHHTGLGVRDASDQAVTAPKANATPAGGSA